jgi:hypothetical protein
LISAEGMHLQDERGGESTEGAVASEKCEGDLKPFYDRGRTDEIGRKWREIGLARNESERNRLKRIATNTEVTNRKSRKGE